jgi:hypothetical protein
MATPAAVKPILNIGKISDSRDKFSFSTDEGTLFCEVSVGKGSGETGQQSDEQKKAEAISKLKRLLSEIDNVIKNFDQERPEAQRARSAPPTPLPLSGNGGMMAVWEAGQIHSDRTQMT